MSQHVACYRFRLEWKLKVNFMDDQTTFDCFAHKCCIFYVKKHSMEYSFLSFVVFEKEFETTEQRRMNTSFGTEKKS